MLMHKILKTHLFRAVVADLKIDAIYALYPESFCDTNLAIRKVFVFFYSGGAGGSCGQLHKVSIGEIAVAEAAILNVVPHPVLKLDTPENKTLS